MDLHCISHLIVLFVCVVTVVHCVSQLEVSLSGDVTVVGLFEGFILRDGKCGDVNTDSVMAAEAVKWYLRNLNSQSDAKIQIGFRGYATCRILGKTEELTARILNEAVTSNSTTIAGVIGPEFSEEVKISSTVLSGATKDFRLPQITYSSTAAPLADHVTYPNFFRVIPNDGTQIRVMVQLLKKLEWNRIGIIFEDDLYGRSGTEGLQMEAEKEGICISKTKGVPIHSSHSVNSDEIRAIISDIFNSNPPISGIVIFGTFTTVRQLLSNLISLGITNYPALIISEGIKLQDSAFKSISNDVMTPSKGSYVTSPPKVVVTEFQDYLTSIFTTNGSLQSEITSNPWLEDVYRKIKNCGSQSCPHVPLDLITAENEISSQSVYIHYAILAAHAMAKAVYEVHSSLCGSSTGACSKFKSEFKPWMMIEKMNKLKIQPATDFSFSIPTLSSRYTHLTFSDSSEIIVELTTPRYEVYNFRKLTSTADSFHFVNVGNYTNSELMLNTDLIRDYDTSGEKTWPDVRKGICQVGDKCEECVPADLDGRYLHYLGDYYVVGVVPISDRGTLKQCGALRVVHGYSVAEAMTYAVGLFNDSRGIYHDQFPGKTIGLIILNSCNDRVTIQAKIADLHKRGLLMESGEYMDVSDKILGYVGAIGSSVSIAMANILTNLQQVQIGYGSTSPALSDRSLFPYFLRVVPPDDKQADAMLQIVQKMNGSYIQVLYSEGSYGEGALSALRLASKKYGICIAQALPVKEDGNYYEHYNDLQKKPSARIVIAVIRSHIIPKLMETLISQMKRGQFQFIGSEAWAKNPTIIQNDPDMKTLGSLTVVVEMSPVDGLFSHIHMLQPKPFRINPWISLYLEKRLNCYFSGSFDKTYPKMCESPDILGKDPTFQLEPWAITSASAVLSLLTGSWSFFKAKCGEKSDTLCPSFIEQRGVVPGGLAEEIIRTARMDIFGAGQLDKVFDDNGGGNVGYVIYNIQKGDDVVQKLQYKRVGRYPLEGAFDFNKNLVVYPGDKITVSVCTNVNGCPECRIQEDSPTCPSKKTTTSSPAACQSTITGLEVGIAVAVLLAIALTVGVVIQTKKLRSLKNDNKDNGYISAFDVMSNTQHRDRVVDPYTPIDQMNQL